MMKKIHRSAVSAGLCVAIWLSLGVAGGAEPHRQSAIPSGLTGYWKLDDGAGTLVHDSSGGGHDGTLLGGAQWISPGRFGGALAFDGATGHVRIPRDAAFESNAISLSVWMSAGAPPSSWANLVRKAWRNDAAPSFTSWGLQLNPAGSDASVVAFNTGYAGGLDVLSSPPGTIVPGRVTHLAAVYELGRKQLYVNGVLAASNTTSMSILYDTTSTGDLYIGQSGAPGEFFYGGVDEIQIYNRALTPEEAAFLANPIAPAAPVGLNARAGDSRVSLDWSAAAGSVPTSYTILRSTTPAGPAIAIASGVTGTAFSDRSLTNLTTYYYNVQASNPAGESGLSNQASAMPSPAAAGDSKNQKCGCGSLSELTGFGMVALGTAGLVLLFPRRRRPTR